jgi:hypothetical protein
VFDRYFHLSLKFAARSEAHPKRPSERLHLGKFQACSKMLEVTNALAYNSIFTNVKSFIVNVPNLKLSHILAIVDTSFGQKTFGRLTSDRHIIKSCQMSVGQMFVGLINVC